MRVDHLPHTMAAPVAMVRSPAHESGTLDTVEISGWIPDDQRLFTPSAQVTPMTSCVKRQSLPVWTPTLPLPLSTTHRVLNFELRTDVGPVGFMARPEQATQEAPKRKVRIVRTFAAILNRLLPLPPILNEFNLPAKCKFMIGSLTTHLRSQNTSLNQGKTKIICSLLKFAVTKATSDQ